MTGSHHQHPSVQLAELTRILTGLHQRWQTTSGGAQAAAVAHAGIYHVSGARWASVVLHRPGQARTLVATAPTAQDLEILQHELGSGPGVDPVLADNACLCPDLAQDHRWPAFGTQAREQLGVASLITCRVPLPEDPDTTVGFTLSSDTPHVFDAQAVWAGALLASQAALAVSAQLHRQQLQNLERALESNREIGAAVGVLMARHGITRCQAFDLLREASQDTGRKLAAIATDVVDTGNWSCRPPSQQAVPAPARSSPVTPSAPAPGRRGPAARPGTPAPPSTGEPGPGGGVTSSRGGSLFQEGRF
ncbi:ANTAR domain-containing protein [Kocuria rhizosphaericola]|uniref:ANTAR domain-containing protein n=1 Tax=Kocuria rhizosphaericola TaxID=3376284 RepID=UPI00379D9317